jgi:hypothetical protein
MCPWKIRQVNTVGWFERTWKAAWSSFSTTVLYRAQEKSPSVEHYALITRYDEWNGQERIQVGAT